MLKDRFQPSKFFISPNLGASCLGWLAAFFAFAVALGFVEQHKLIQWPDILRRYIFQIFLITALISLYRQGWRPSLALNRRVLSITLLWLLLYALGIEILNLIFLFSGHPPTQGVPDFLLSDQILLSGLLAPIVEELFFRDILFRSFLVRWPRIVIAIVASSFFFMVAHQSFYLGALLLGIVNSILFIYSGSVFPGIVFHSVSNLSWYFLPKLFPYFFEALKTGGWLNLFYRNS